MDVREAIYDRLQLGMSEIRISRHPLRKDIIVALHHTEHDIYLDVADSSEFARIFKQAIVRKNVDMAYVQEQFGVLAEPDDILPFHILFTRTGVPRPPKLDDRIIIDGTVYVVSKLKPTNRELTAIYECLVYPERDARRVNDPLALYYIRFRRGIEEVTGEDIYTGPVIMEVVYGGCPTLMSFDGEHWQPFYQRSGVTIPSWTNSLYIMDAEQRTVQLEFGETFSVESSYPTSPQEPVESYLDVQGAEIVFEEPLTPQQIDVVSQPAPRIEVPTSCQQVAEKVPGCCPKDKNDTPACCQQVACSSEASYRHVSYGGITRLYPTLSNDYYVQLTYVLDSEYNGQYIGHYYAEVVGYDATKAVGFCFPFAIVAGDKEVWGSLSFQPKDTEGADKPGGEAFGNDSMPQKTTTGVHYF